MQYDNLAHYLEEMPKGTKSPVLLHSNEAFLPYDQRVARFSDKSSRWDHTHEGLIGYCLIVKTDTDSVLFVKIK